MLFAVIGIMAQLAPATVLLLTVFGCLNGAFVILKNRDGEPRGRFDIPLVLPGPRRSRLRQPRDRASRNRRLAGADLGRRAAVRSSSALRAVSAQGTTSARLESALVVL